MAKTIDVDVRLDDKMFRRYCAFDTFRRQRRWYWPVLAAMLLITVALAGLFGLVSLPESASGVLMGLGIAVPMVVFGLYAIQIEAQVARQQLRQAPAVYALRLSAEGVRVTNARKDEPPVDIAWDRLWAAFRRADCVYLYVSPERALILPDGQASVSPQALWDFLKKNLGEARCVEGKKGMGNRQ